MRADNHHHMNYGHAIKMARTARGLTQRELADELGIASSYVSLLESGKRTPSLETLQQAALALEIPLHLLILMASSEEELHGLDSAEAATLSKHLLSILLSKDLGQGG